MTRYEETLEQLTTLNKNGGLPPLEMQAALLARIVLNLATIADELTENRRSQGKQKPQMPFMVADGYADGYPVFDTWRCPTCDCSYETETEQFDYCPHCGQAIDWAAVNNQTPFDD